MATYVNQDAWANALNADYNALQIARREAAYAEWLHQQRHAIHATFDTPERAAARIGAQYPLRRAVEHPWVSFSDSTEFRVEGDAVWCRVPGSAPEHKWELWPRSFVTALAKQFESPGYIDDAAWHGSWHE